MHSIAKNLFQDLKRAHASLEKAVILAEKQKNSEYSDTFQDSVIQRYEYTFELSWKFLKKYLFETYGKETIYAKDTIKEAFRADLIDDMETWFDMVDTRNRLSHDYHEGYSQKSYERVSKEYTPTIAEMIRTIYRNIS